MSFTVKFVETKGKKTDYAVQAYEVNSIIKPVIDHCCAVSVCVFDDDVCLLSTGPVRAAV